MQNLHAHEGSLLELEVEVSFKAKTSEIRLS